MAQARMYDARMSPNKIDYDTPVAPPPDNNDQIGTKTDDYPTNDDYWLLVARDAYNEAESYFDANVRDNLERNMSHFANRHAPGSKYWSNAYRFRHKGFRPKTRAMVRRNEAAAAVALFATKDVVNIEAARSNHPSHRVSAEINQHLLQYRLTNTIPWFQTSIGAYQETINNGLCISHQYWDYQELPEMEADDDEMVIGPNRERMGDKQDDSDVYPRDEQKDAYNGDEVSTASANSAFQNLADKAEDDFEGEYQSEYDEFLDEATNAADAERGPKIISDTPAIELRPIENVFFSVACDWRDPANTSPFIIDKIPMYIDDIKLMAEPGNGTRVPWFRLTDSQLLTGVTTDYDPVRRQREENREDSKEQRHLHRGFDVAWVHRNIIRKDGRDWIYYTLGVHYRLSNPIPLEEEYPWLKPGERPYVIGFSNLEAHKNYPDSLVGLTAKTQQEANEINNQRRDNVALSLNRRYIVKRSAMIDYAGLQRNVPGGVTEADDPTNDIRIEAPPDVTASSYQEQDRVNLDFDELSGMFSGSSVGTNRNLNETVGGMELLAGDADALTEYPLRVFVQTWVLPVLKQLVRLEQTHESDGALLNLIGEKLKLWQRFGIERVTDEWIQGSMNLDVNVGFGSTNPQQRVNRLAMGLQTILGFAPQLQQQLDGVEVAKEVMGALGFMGADRFFPEEGPKSAPPQTPTEGDVTEQSQAELDQDMVKHQAEMEDRNRQREWEIQKHYDLLEDKERDRLAKDQISQREFEERMERIKTDRQNKVDEMTMKIRTGQQGI